jgi:hypothetical protein
MAVTQAAPWQISLTVLVAVARRAAYPKSHPTEEKTDGIRANSPAKSVLLPQICGHDRRGLSSCLAKLCPI